jgi:hypothetical protein
VFERLKTAWARFSAEFRREYAEAQSKAKAQASLAPDNPFDTLMIAAAIRGAHDEGRQAERDRVAEILNAPGAEELPQLAMFLVLGDATAVQATSILAKAENDASKRVAMTRAQQPAIPTFH